MPDRGRWCAAGAGSRAAETWTLAVVTALALGACGGAGGASSSHTVEVIDGVETVTNAGAGAWSDEPGSVWIVSGPRVRLGALEGGPEVFGSIGAVAIGPGGTIYVGDATAQEVRAFDASGGFLRSFGRKGEGPGEFGAIDGIAVESDGSVLVRDPRIGRASRFDDAGAFESSFRLERSFFVFSDGTSWWVDGEDRAYDQVPLSSELGGPEGLGLVWYRNGAFGDTLRALEFSTPTVMVTRGGRTVLGMLPPFIPPARAAVRADGIVAATLGREYRITERTAEGQLRRVILRDSSPPVLPEGAREDGLRSMRQRVEEMAPGATLGDVEFPPRYPAYVRLVADPEGFWWAGRYRGERDEDDPTAHLPTEYDVYDRDGIYQGVVETPPILIMQIGGDFVAGIDTDPIGIQHAVVHALDRRGGVAGGLSLRGRASGGPA